MVGKDDDGTKRMSLIARAAESIGDGDIINVQIRRYQRWQLSQSGALASCIIPYVLLIQLLQVQDFVLVLCFAIFFFFEWSFTTYLVFNYLFIIFGYNQCCTVVWAEGNTSRGKGLSIS